MRFLLAQNKSYIPFRSQILAMEAVPPLGHIFQLAVQEENQSLTSMGHEKGGESVALATPARPAHQTYGGSWPPRHGLDCLINPHAQMK